MSSPLPACSARAHRRCGWGPAGSLVQGGGGEEGRVGGLAECSTGDGLGGGFTAPPCRLACNSAPQPACAPTCDGQRVLHPLQQAGGRGEGHHLRAGTWGQGGLLGWRREGPIAAGTTARRAACLPQQHNPTACQAQACQACCTGLVCADEEGAALGAGRLRQELVDQPEELLHHSILAQVVVSALDLCSDVGMGAQGGLVGRQLGGGSGGQAAAIPKCVLRGTPGETRAPAGGAWPPPSR